MPTQEERESISTGSREQEQQQEQQEQQQRYFTRSAWAPMCVCTHTKFTGVHDTHTQILVLKPEANTTAIVSIYFLY